MWFTDVWPNLGQTNETIVRGSLNNDKEAVKRIKFAATRLRNFCDVDPSLFSKAIFCNTTTQGDPLIFFAECHIFFYLP